MQPTTEEYLVQPLTLKSLASIVSKCFLVQCINILQSVTTIQTQVPAPTSSQLESLRDVLLNTSPQATTTEITLDFTSVHFLSKEDVDYFMQILHPHREKISFFQQLLSQLSLATPDNIIHVVLRFLSETDFSLDDFFEQIPFVLIYNGNMPTLILSYLNNLYTLSVLKKSFSKESNVQELKDEISQLQNPRYSPMLLRDPKIPQETWKHLSTVMIQNPDVFTNEDLYWLGFDQQLTRDKLPEKALQDAHLMQFLEYYNNKLKE